MGTTITEVGPESPVMHGVDEWPKRLDEHLFARLESIYLSRVTADSTSRDHGRPRETTGDHGRRRMLVYEYKLRLSRAQAAAIEEAIRTTQFIRNKALRLWRDGRGVSANDLQVLCSRLAHEYPFAAALNSQARQAAAARAWAAIERFYTNCREQRPGKKGYPRFQHDCRSVEHKQTGWQLDPDGKRLTLTDGGGIGCVRLIGSRDLATFPVEQIKRVRLLRRADGFYAQFDLQAERRIQHVATGAALGIDV